MNGGPFFSFAVICENVLFEMDGVHSLIRIIDGIQIPQLATQDAGPHYALTMAIGFRSGEYVGMKDVSIVMALPDGTKIPYSTGAVEFGGGATGANLLVKGGVAFKQEGLYWFEVFLEKEFVTQVPLRVDLPPSQSSKRSESASIAALPAPPQPPTSE